jgi:catechol O-methyltransferase
VLELGTYVGYSAIAFARHLKAAHPAGALPGAWSTLKNDAHATRVGYICIEQNPTYAAAARAAVELAGLGDVVQVRCSAARGWKMC